MVERMGYSVPDVISKGTARVGNGNVLRARLQAHDANSETAEQDPLGGASAETPGRSDEGDHRDTVYGTTKRNHLVTVVVVSKWLSFREMNAMVERMNDSRVRVIERMFANGRLENGRRRYRWLYRVVMVVRRGELADPGRRCVVERSKLQRMFIADERGRQGRG